MKIPFMQEKYGIVSNYTGIFVFKVILAFYVDMGTRIPVIESLKFLA